MTDPAYTHIILVLDQSGSMGAIRDATIEAFNSFIEQQKAQPGRATLTLVQFNDDRLVTNNFQPLDQAEPLSIFNYRPTGGTALYDAVGFAVDRVGEQLAAMPEATRPGKVLLVIQTDGEENSSRTFTARDIRERLERQQRDYSWGVVYLGVGADCFKDAEAMGIAKGFTVAYQATAQGMHATGQSLSFMATSYRGGTDLLAAKVQAFGNTP